MIKMIAAAALLLAGMSLPARAQDGTITRSAGFLDLQTIEGWFDTEATLEVNVKGALLRMVTEASRGEDPALADLLSGLEAIQVRGYTLTADERTDILSRTADLGRTLERSGWETVARVREEDEDVFMYVKSRQDNIAGLVVMVVSPGENETVFVNIVGDIRPEDVGKIGRKFNIGPLSKGDDDNR